MPPISRTYLLHALRAYVYELPVLKMQMYLSDNKCVNKAVLTELRMFYHHDHLVLSRQRAHKAQ